MQSYEKMEPEAEMSGNADKYRLCDDVRGSEKIW
jgi:hypothetical protein